MLIYSIIPGGDFGVAIIIFTILVRFALYPLTRSMLHQSRAMRKLQPELARIKKQTKGNRQAESMQMMELYKKHNVSPFRSIGILLIQLPIFIALYSVIRIITLERDQIAKYTYDFLENIGPIKHLIEHPDQFKEKLFGVVDLVNPAFHEGSVNLFLILIALIAAVTQYFMSRQTMPSSTSNRRLRDILAEAAEGKQADQSEMNAVVMKNMSKVLPVFMFFIMVSVPGALALYYAVSNLVALGQQAYLIRLDEEEMDQIASEPVKKQSGKKATTKAREKQAKEATVTRIVAKDSGRKKS